MARVPGLAKSTPGSGAYPKQNGVRFVADPLAERKLASWPGLIPELEWKVKSAEVAAKAIAPVETGRYKESIESAVGFDERAKIIGRLYSKDWKAHWVEFGTIKEPAHAPLRRAMNSIGLRVVEKRRKGSK